MTAVGVPEDVQVRSVGEVTRLVKQALETGVGEVWVEGEISNLKRPPSGHMYLTLKDNKSQLRGVIYRGIALRLRFDPNDGQEVIARGEVGVYEPRGEYQLTIRELLPKGIGPLELALQQLKEKLLTRGYFRPERKRGLPRFPRRVALIASLAGAALRDMLRVLAERWPVAEVLVVGSRVQGQGAAEELAAAVGLLNRLQGEGHIDFDFLILGRGGGSLEDLWAFNEEAVATAIFESQIPVVSAVGHEIDYTVADLVADLRAATPSHAIEETTPDVADWLPALRQTAGRLDEALRRRFELARRRLDELAARPALRRPLDRVRELERRLDDVGERLVKAARRRIEADKRQVASLAERLETLSPLNVLARGYSLTLTESRGLVDSIRRVRPGEVVRTVLADGELVSRVEGIESPGVDRP